MSAAAGDGGAGDGGADAGAAEEDLSETDEEVFHFDPGPRGFEGDHRQHPSFPTYTRGPGRIKKVEEERRGREMAAFLALFEAARPAAAQPAAAAPSRKRRRRRTRQEMTHELVGDLLEAAELSEKHARKD